LALLKRFVIVGRHEATAITLWVMLTYAVAITDCVPYLSITSPEKGSGKTRLLEVLELLVFHPWLTGRTTPAVLARKIDRERPTLLLDEADAAFSGEREYAEVLRGVLNSGYLRSGKTSLCVAKGKSIEYVDLSTFGPKAIAGIGDLPDTVAHRSIPIRLERKLMTETVERFRRKRVAPQADELAARLKAWAKSIVVAEHSEPQGLDDLPDRAADIWEPLYVIADSCDARVAEMARSSAQALCGRARDDDSPRSKLLKDIRRVFESLARERISSESLAERLASMEESPWGPKFGRDFDPRALARLLKPFGIQPSTIRLGVTTSKGYHRFQFEDAWKRYVQPPPEERSQSSRPLQANGDKDRRTSATVTNPSLDDYSTVTHADGWPASTGRPAVTLPQPSRRNGRQIEDETEVTDVTGTVDGPGCLPIGGLREPDEIVL
jgi:hypothetical protein